MATTVSSNEAISSTPFLIRKIECVDANGDAAAITHSGPALIPDMVLATVTSTGDQLAVTAKTTTTVTVDAEGACTYDLYCIWFSQATGGISE